jgi:c-di-AMP phosphodiesterase-like protein
MITDKSIHKFCSIALIVCSVVAFGVSFYFGYWIVLILWLMVTIFIFAVSFVMEWFHVSITDPIHWLIARFESRKNKHEIER